MQNEVTLYMNKGTFGDNVCAKERPYLPSSYPQFYEIFEMNSISPLTVASALSDMFTQSLILQIKWFQIFEGMERKMKEKKLFYGDKEYLSIVAPRKNFYFYDQEGCFWK